MKIGNCKIIALVKFNLIVLEIFYITLNFIILMVRDINTY